MSGQSLEFSDQSVVGREVRAPQTNPRDGTHAFRYFAPDAARILTWHPLHFLVFALARMSERRISTRAPTLNRAKKRHHLTNAAILLVRIASQCAPFGSISSMKSRSPYSQWFRLPSISFDGGLREGFQYLRTRVSGKTDELVCKSNRQKSILVHVTVQLLNMCENEVEIWYVRQ